MSPDGNPTYQVVKIPGDGIGPEIVSATLSVLEAAQARFGFDIEWTEVAAGGIGIDTYGEAVRDEDLDVMLRSDAVFLGAVGGPKWDDPAAKVRPEQGLLKIRKVLGLFANLRPVPVHPALAAAAPLKTELLAVASPRYLERAGVPGSVDALAEHSCLRGFDGGSRPATAWPLRDGGTVTVSGSFVTTDLMARLGATLVGAGISLLPRAIVDAELERGELVPVLEGVIGRRVSLSAVWVEREFIEPKVRAFVEHAVEWATEGRLLP